MRIFFSLATVAVAALMPARAAEPPLDAPLLQRGSVVVTVEDFNASMSRLPDDRRFAYRADAERILKNASSLFITRALAQEARAAGIDQEADIKTRLKLQEESMLAQVYMDRFEAAVKPPNYEARAREIYATNPEKFRTPETVKYRYILVDKRGRTAEEARRRAEEARKRLLDKENFDSVARDYSNDPTYRGNNGEIGPIPYREMVAEVADAVRKAKPGEVSEVFESPDGFHLVAVLERHPARVVPYDQAKKALIDAEEAQFRKNAANRKISDVGSKEVMVFKDNIAALKTEVDEAQLRRLHQEEAAKESKGVQR
jgi:peptidyl-prolyl cis-trans isomerase C